MSVHRYPMQISPVYRSAIWGGTSMRTRYGFSSQGENIAEAWVLSARGDGAGTVQNGVYLGIRLDALLSQHPELIADGNDDPTLPLLIKIIDAKEPLSVQVHPTANDGNAESKTEMWVILDAKEGATLTFGTKAPFTKDALCEAIADGTFTDMFNTVSVCAGDVFYIPAGLIHAIGGGILLCEIQQSSDTTYRVYDYGRRTEDGHTRPLHIEKALGCARHLTEADIAKLRYERGQGDCLACGAYFRVWQKTVTDTETLSVSGDSFVSLLVTDGEGVLLFGDTVYPLLPGTSLFLPAGMGEYRVRGDAEVTLILSTL